MARIPKLGPREIDMAFTAAQCVVETHRRMVPFLKVGQTLGQIDSEVARVLEDLGCQSCFHGYRIGRGPAFTGHACLSVNDCVVHGFPGSYDRPMRPGDLLKIDIGVWKNGFVGDAGWTYCFKGYPSDIAKRLMDVGRESLRRGITKLSPTNTYMAWAREVQTCVEVEHKLHLVRGLGGHGIGMKKNDRERGLHLPPFVSNVVPASHSDWPESTLACEPGVLIAVEPMLAAGTGETASRGNPWPVYTKDGSLSSHYEHDVLITDKGPRVLTEGMDELPDIVG